MNTASTKNLQKNNQTILSWYLVTSENTNNLVKFPCCGEGPKEYNNMKSICVVPPILVKFAEQLVLLDLMP